MSRHGKTKAMRDARVMAEGITDHNASLACAWALDMGMNWEALHLIALDQILERNRLLEEVPVSAMQREIRARAWKRNDEIDALRAQLTRRRAHILRRVAEDERVLERIQHQARRAADAAEALAEKYDP